MSRESAYKIKIGYAPTRRNGGGPPNEPAWEIRDLLKKRIYAILGKMHDVEIVDIEWVNEEGLLYANEDAKKVGRYFLDQEVDCVFMPSCNFGCEEVVGIVGKMVQKPFLVWAPRDGMPPKGHQWRPLDFQCGLFTIGNVLRRRGLPFTYIENCWSDSPVLEEGLDQFIRVASIVKAFYHIRIGQIGMRPEPFLSVMYNEGELMERFGIEVEPIEGTDILARMKDILANRAEDVDREAARIESQIDCSQAFEDVVRNTAALELAVKELKESRGCTAFATECWKVIVDEFKVWPCYAVGDLSEEGIILGCETDVLGAISSVIMAAASRGETPTFLADLTIRNPLNDNSELLWHCGPFPQSLRKEGAQAKLVDEGYGQFEIKGGDITIGRLAYNTGDYVFLVEEVTGCEGPETCGTYVYIEAKDWPKLERKLVKGPYIHHVSGVHGNYEAVIREAMRYINGIEVDDREY